jgi:hypothetical protein
VVICAEAVAVEPRRQAIAMAAPLSQPCDVMLLPSTYCLS